MPKDKRSNPSTSNQHSRISPYDCNSKNNCRNCKNEFESTSDEKNLWEETRCPICMEHPHNAVLLICSSHDKGCRPFICDTSHRHSNCFDQFCQLHGLTPSKSTSTDDQPNGFLHCGNSRVLGLVCPLCRGNISGWIVVQGARTYMNSRIRGCSLESCDFSGNYGVLRKHARLQHSWARPSEVDDERQSVWERLERNNHRELEFSNRYFYQRERIRLNFNLNPYRDYRIVIDYVSSHDMIMEVSIILTY